MADEIEKVDAHKDPPESPESGSKEKSKDEEGEHIDYKALWEKDQERLNKAEAIIQRHKEKPEEERVERDTNLEQLASLIDEKLVGLESKLTSQFRANEISDRIAKVSSDAEEAARVKWYLENRVRPSGDIELDIEDARAMALKGRFQRTEAELKASIQSLENRSGGSGAGRKPKTEPHDDVLPPLTDADRKVLSDLRQTYVISNSAARRIMNGDSMDSLLEQGIVKKR